MNTTLQLLSHKLNKDGDWLLGLSGIQPLDQKDISTDASLVVLTGNEYGGHQDDD